MASLLWVVVHQGYELAYTPLQPLPVAFILPPTVTTSCCVRVSSFGVKTPSLHDCAVRSVTYQFPSCECNF